MPPISLSLGNQIPSLSVILVVTPALSDTSPVLTGGSLRSTSSGVSTVLESAKFIRLLVLLRGPPVNTDNAPDNAGVATSIADKYGIWFTKLSEIGGTAATHDDLKNISETLAFKQYVKDIDFETIKALEQENIEQENMSAKLLLKRS